MDLLAVFNLERGFLYTVKMLFVRPGQVTNDYIRGKTRSYINPLKYLLIIGGIYAFLILYLKIFDTGLETMSGLQTNEALNNVPDETVQLQQQWLHFYRQIINFIPLLLIPFISIATRLFYRSKKLYYGEHLIINSFLIVQSFLIITLLTPLILIFPSAITYFPFLTPVVFLGYLIYSLKSTYGGSPFKSVFGAIFSFLFGYLLFLLFILFVTILIGIIIFSLK
jgi:hypothetical protein